MKNKLHVLVLFILFSSSSFGAHLMGGSMTYQYLNYDSTLSQYHYLVKLHLLRDCNSPTPLISAVDLGVYVQDSANPNADKTLYSLFSLNLDSLVSIPLDSGNCNHSVCIQEGFYSVEIFLEQNPGGYHLLAELFARNNTILNLLNPGIIGFTYYSFVPPTFINSSPEFNDSPFPFICGGNTTTILNTVGDSDGDSLSYSFVVPYDSYSHPIAPFPPLISLPPPEVPYNMPTYSFTQPFGPGGYAIIDSITGAIEYYIPNQGNYVTCIEVREFRNGNLISFTRRDIQLVSLICQPNQAPLFTSAHLVDTITIGQTLCFPVTFSDPDADSLHVHASGNIFDSTFVNPPAIFTDTSGMGSASSTFCWTPDSSQVSPSPYQFVVRALDNGCPHSDSTNVLYSIYVQYPSTVGFDSPDPLNEILIYPNPSVDDFTLTFKKHLGEKAWMKIYDVPGQAVFEKSFIVSSSEIIHHSEINLRKGIYVVEIIFADHGEKKKLLVE